MLGAKHQGQYFAWNISLMTPPDSECLLSAVALLRAGPIPRGLAAAGAWQVRGSRLLPSCPGRSSFFAAVSAA